MCLLHRWQVQVVGSDAVGLGGPGFDSMSPAKIRRAASHCGDPHGWLTEKNCPVLLPTKDLVGGGLRG